MSGIRHVARNLVGLYLTAHVQHCELFSVTASDSSARCIQQHHQVIQQTTRPQCHRIQDRDIITNAHRMANLEILSRLDFHARQGENRENSTVVQN